MVDAIPYPVTTPPECVSALIDYVQKYSPETRIIVAEGSGGPEETGIVFEKLGYTTMCRKKEVELIDLNHEKTIRLKMASMKVFQEYHIPEIAMDSYIISVPVLKAHSLANVTLSLKNMMGFNPVETDWIGAELLGFDWRDIPHIGDMA